MRCVGIVQNKESVNYGKRCSIYCEDNEDCKEYYCKYHKKQINNKEKFIKIISDLLKELEETEGRENKKKIAIDIFEIVILNIYLIKTKIIKKFYMTILKKCDELIFDNFIEIIEIKKRIINYYEEIDELKY